MQAESPHRRSLSSWKEIAAHFDRDVRTAQRWEKYEGLPVYRHPHKSRNSVYAFEDELDAWWQGHGVEAGAGADETAATDAAPTLVGEAVAGPPPESPSSEPASRLPLAATAALLAASGALVYLALVARADGHAHGTAVRWPVDHYYSTVLAADIDGDGRDEILLSSEEHRIQRVHRVNDDGSLGDVLVQITADGPALPHFPQPADFNGDGVDDLLVTTFNPQEISATAPAFVIFGRRDWPGRLLLPQDADVRLELETTNDARLNGCPSRERFDLNHDGIQDLVLSATEYSAGDRRSAGAVFVVFGRRSWPTVMNVLEADVRIVGARSGSGLGDGCATGDWDGDGWTDLAVQSSEGTLWEMLGARGRTHVFRGGPQWAARLDAATDVLLRIDHPTPGSWHQQIALADINGDGRADLVRSTPRAHGRGAGRSALRIWFGGRAAGVRTGRDEDTRIDLPALPGAEWGRALAAGDVDGDGVDDLILGEATGGSVWFLAGRTVWPAAAPLGEVGTRLWTAGSPSGHEGWSVSDADGDGLPEVLMPLGAEPRTQPAIAVVELFEPLPFEVRPGSARKLVLVPGTVAVQLSGAHVDVNTLDPASIRLNGLAPWKVRPGDDDEDGKPDLRLYFETHDLALPRPLATLTARRRDGRLVGGSQPIEIVRRAADR